MITRGANDIVTTTTNGLMYKNCEIFFFILVLLLLCHVVVVIILAQLVWPGYVLISHEFILSRCSRAVLSWAQLVGASSVERERIGQYICILPYIKRMSCSWAL